MSVFNSPFTSLDIHINIQARIFVLGHSTMDVHGTWISTNGYQCFILTSVFNYSCFYRYPFECPLISLDIHAWTCNGIPAQGSLHEEGETLEPAVSLWRTPFRFRNYDATFLQNLAPLSCPKEGQSPWPAYLVWWVRTPRLSESRRLGKKVSTEIGLIPGFEVASQLTAVSQSSTLETSTWHHVLCRSFCWLLQWLAHR